MDLYPLFNFDSRSIDGKINVRFLKKQKKLEKSSVEIQDLTEYAV